MVGQPIPMGDLLTQAQDEAWSEDQLYTAIAQRVGDRLHTMHAQLVHGEAVLALDDESSAMSKQGAGGGSTQVSDRDLFDPADLLDRARPPRVWDRVAFKMWHRGWAVHSAVEQGASAVRMKYAQAKRTAREAREALTRYGLAASATLGLE